MKTFYRFSIRLARVFLCVLAFSMSLWGQRLPEMESHPHAHDTIHPMCGSIDNASNYPNRRRTNVVTPATPLTAATSATSAGGFFVLIFEDCILGNDYGFDHPTNGAAHRHCVMEAVNYLETVIEIPATADPIEIFMQSDASVTLPSAALAGAAYYFPATFTQGFHGGLMYDHLMHPTGADPDPAQFDGNMIFNFLRPWASDCSLPIPDCRFDMQTVMLHELGHLLGHASFVDGSGAVPGSRYGGDQYSIFDREFLYRFDAGTFTQVVDQSGPPVVDASLSTADLVDQNIWLTNTAFPDNHPIVSGTAWISGTTLSHLAENYVYQNAHAPQYLPDYVMDAFLKRGETKREFIPRELEILESLGYTIRSSYVDFPILGNTPPHFTGNLAMPTSEYWLVTPPSGIPEFYYTTDNCGTVTIDLNSIPNIFDADSDPISIYPGTIHNFRGCGDGGNNHNQLSINAAQDEIVFTPRADFFGRAQFGLHLYDGKEKGAYVVFTIDVARNTACFTPPGPNLVMNGDFEAGSEIQLISQPNVTREQDRPYFRQMGTFDGKNAFSPGWDDTTVRESWLICKFGFIFESFDPGNAP
ncbi:MAG: hypothetical protein AAF570_13010, partial [Bacteroidota bacterium]